MLRLVFLVSAALLTVFYYYFFGAGPTASDYMDDLAWWQPWGTLMRDLHFASLAQMARAGFPQAWVPILRASCRRSRCARRAGAHARRARPRRDVLLRR